MPTVGAMPFDPTNATMLSSPYPHFEQLRSSETMQFSPQIGMWLVSRFDDVSHVLRSPEIFSSAMGTRKAFPLMYGDPDTESVARGLTASDPPEHTFLRKLVSHGFTPFTLRSWQPKVQAIADELTAELIEKSEAGTADFVKDLADMLPAYVIGEILDLPREQCHKFRSWSDAIIAAYVPGSDPEDSLRKAREMYHYFADHVEEKRSHPGETDVISVLCAKSGDAPDPLTTEELASFCALLMVAGHETTTNLLGNWCAEITEDDELQRLLREDESLIARSLEESLRLESPSQVLFRGVRQPTELHGVRLDYGERLGIMFGSANRDREHWGPTADEFDVRRKNVADHVAFGQGIHFCLGAALTRLEGMAAAQALFARTKWISARGEPVRTVSFAIRGCLSVPVSVTV